MIITEPLTWIHHVAHIKCLGNIDHGQVRTKDACYGSGKKNSFTFHRTITSISGCQYAKKTGRPSDAAARYHGLSFDLLRLPVVSMVVIVTTGKITKY
jgi:hypothetical protein